MAERSQLEKTLNKAPQAIIDALLGLFDMVEFDAKARLDRVGDGPPLDEIRNLYIEGGKCQALNDLRKHLKTIREKEIE